MHLYFQKNKVKTIFIILFFTLFIFKSHSASAATLSIVPTNGSFEAGEHVAVKIVATSNNVPFNAVSGTVVFPPSLFTIESVSKTHSVLDFWVTEPSVSKNSGTIKFEGVALGGFTGPTGTVLTVNLRANNAGTGRASFESGQILANDGEGTDITGNLIGATFYVKEATPKPKSTTPTPKEEVVPVPAPEKEKVVEVTQPVPSLTAPQIMLGTKYGAQSIIGTSDHPKAQTLVTFVSENGTKIFIIGTAETDGSFNILIPSTLKRGKYTVSAVMIKEDKTNSDTSNVIIAQFGNIFSDVGWEIQLVLVLLILVIIYLIIRIHFHFLGSDHKSKNKNEAKKIISKSFDLLREDVTDHESVSELKKDINEIEKVINKEIKEIESE